MTLTLNLGALLQDDGEGEADWREPCSECGRRYYHEHVRAVHGSEAGSTDDELGDRNDGLI